MTENPEEIGKSEIFLVAEIYERLYYQFVDLMNFSYNLAGSYRKANAVAAIISREVAKIDGIKNNAVWIVTAPNTLVKMAQNGAMIPEDGYNRVDWNSMRDLNMLIHSQRVSWGPFEKTTLDMLDGLQKPMLFPIRGLDHAQGFLAIDASEQTETERCQYITKFSSMILEMSRLYFRLEDEIRERRILEELLTKEKNTLQSYLDVAKVMLVALDNDGKVELINRRGCEILGYPTEQVIGKNWFDNFVDLNDRVRLTSVFSQLMDHGFEPEQFVEYNIINSHGEKRIVEWHSTRVFAEDGRVNGTINCGSDVTDQKRSDTEKQAIQSQLFQAQKMEALGTLVDGIAHDFNNMLQAIIGYSELVFEEMTPGRSGYQETQRIIETAHGGAELVNKLLVFSQQAHAFPINFDLNKQVEDLGILLVRALPQETKVFIGLSGSKPIVHADPNQIAQCIMNIAINASEAMPNGGVLEIKSADVFVNEDFCRTHPGLTPGNHVALTISDTGRGMDRKTLSRIFEPFFSTKQRGSTRGTGLGLSVVKGILDKNGSLITCESQPGQGTTFTIYFRAIE